MRKYASLWIQEKVPHCLCGVLGSILTFYIWNRIKMNNIIVCQSLILIFSLVLPKHDDIFFASALSGLTAKIYMPYEFSIFIVALLVIFFFNAIKNLFIGYGGKYGVIAFLSNLIPCSFFALDQNYKQPFYDQRFYEALDFYIYIFGPLVCGFTSLLASFFALKMKFKNKHSAVISSGLLFSFLLILISKSPNEGSFSFTYGEIFILFDQVGLLCALSKENFFKMCAFKQQIFHNYFLMGYLAGWINIASIGICNIGGKVGVVAFLATNFYIRSIKVLRGDYDFTPKKQIFNSGTNLDLQNPETLQ